MHIIKTNKDKAQDYIYKFQNRIENHKEKYKLVRLEPRFQQQKYLLILVTYFLGNPNKY